MEEQQPEQPKRKRGRPRTKPEGYDRQAEWKKRTSFERSSVRREYKRQWERSGKRRKGDRS